MQWREEPRAQEWCSKALEKCSIALGCALDDLCNSKLSPSSLLYLPNGSHFLSLDLDFRILGFTLDFGTVLSEDPFWILHEDLKEKTNMFSELLIFAG